MKFANLKFGADRVRLLKEAIDRCLLVERAVGGKALVYSDSDREHLEAMRRILSRQHAKLVGLP